MVFFHLKSYFEKNIQARNNKCCSRFIITYTDK